MRIFLIIFLAVCTLELEAQITAGRQTFSSGGSIAGGSTINASSTLGEAITGTSSGTAIVVTQGFQQSSEGGTTSIETPWDDKFEVVLFPNPVIDKMTLKLTGVLDKPLKVQLFEASGRVVSGWDFSIRQPGETSLSTKTLASGTYFLRVSQESSGKVHSIPFIRQ